MGRKVMTYKEKPEMHIQNSSNLGCLIFVKIANHFFSVIIFFVNKGKAHNKSSQMYKKWLDSLMME